MQSSSDEMTEAVPAKSVMSATINFTYRWSSPLARALIIFVLLKVTLLVIMRLAIFITIRGPLVAVLLAVLVAVLLGSRGSCRQRLQVPLHLPQLGSCKSMAWGFD